MLGHTGAHPLGKPVERILLNGVIDDFLFAHDIPRHIARTTQGIYQAQAYGLLARPDQPAEQLRVLLVFQALATALLHAGDELLVSGFQHTLPERRLFGLLRLERVKERFSRPEGQQASGSGLGLSIAERIAELRELKLTLDNRPGGGFIARLSRVG